MNRVAIAMLAAAAAAPALAAAPHWHSLHGAGTLEWTARWQGIPVKGAFPDFTVTGAFDARNPAGGKVEVAIDTRTVATASADVTRAIRGKPWFDTAEYPQARFTGTFAKEPNGLALRGTLQLNGRSRELSFPVHLRRQAAGRVLLSGGLRLDRGDFAIGTGQWKSGALIASTVTVNFSVVLAGHD